MPDDSPTVQAPARSLRNVVSAVAMAPPNHPEGLRALELLVAIHGQEVAGHPVPALLPIFDELCIIAECDPETAKRRAEELSIRLVTIDQWIARFGGEG